jgi:hypothetical protein
VTFDPEEGARISSALIKAITEAKVMADAGDVGPGLRDLVRHARDLYELLLEQLIAAGPDAAEDVRGMCDDITIRLDQLEALVNAGPNPPMVY